MQRADIRYAVIQAGTNVAVFGALDLQKLNHQWPGDDLLEAARAENVIEEIVRRENRITIAISRVDLEAYLGTTCGIDLLLKESLLYEGQPGTLIAYRTCCLMPEGLTPLDLISAQLDPLHR